MALHRLPRVRLHGWTCVVLAVDGIADGVVPPVCRLEQAVVSAGFCVKWRRTS